MFGFFKKDKESEQLDAKGLRDAILQMIKEELQQLDGGEGSAVAKLQLFVNAAPDHRFIYDAALYNGNVEKLQEDVQRIADNFALDLPSLWKLEVLFVEELPAGVIKREGINAGILFKTASVALPSETGNHFQGCLKVLKGRAEQEEYILKPEQKRVNIGRERSIQANDGSFRINDIAFPEDQEHESNKYISRQHAHVEWDNQTGSYKFFADEGGVPPSNKTKIRSAKDESIYKLNSTHIGYPLNEGDQLILGDAAVLEFTVLIK